MIVLASKKIKFAFVILRMQVNGSIFNQILRKTFVTQRYRLWFSDALRSQQVPSDSNFTEIEVWFVPILPHVSQNKPLSLVLFELIRAWIRRAGWFRFVQNFDNS